MIVCNRCRTECNTAADLKFIWTKHSISASRPLFKGDLCKPCKDELLPKITSVIEDWLKSEVRNENANG